MKRKTDSSFDDLLFDNDIGGEGGTTTLRISDIEPNKNQPRKNFDNETLKQLADSIREHGVLQPLLVRSTEAGGYLIVAGERRWRAAKMAGLSEVPVVIRDDLSDEQAAQIALIENLQRENLNPIEEALGYRELMDDYKMTQEQLSRALGKARSSIANSLGLLTLPDEVRKMIVKGQLSPGHCKALKSIKDEKTLVEAAKNIAEGELSVRQVEKMAKSVSAEKKTRLKKRSAYYTEIEGSLSELLGTKVSIREGRGVNTLQIDFVDEEDLESLVRQYFMSDDET